jgi:RimJ/RimL family protein N-acetyltransferase
MSEFVFRECTVNDAAMMTSHMCAVGGETDFLTYSADTFNISERKEASFISRFERSPRDVIYIAQDTESSEIAGVGIVECARGERLSHNAEISLTVLRKHWGKGIGSRLMEMMIAFAKANGTHALTLFARADNDRALTLYEKYGFQRTGCTPDFFKIGDSYYDAVTMYLALSARGLEIESTELY